MAAAAAAAAIVMVVELFIREEKSKRCEVDSVLNIGKGKLEILSLV